MHRYGNIGYILTLDIDDFMGMYVKAKKENSIEQLWSQWLVEFGRMDKEHFISFEDYKKKAFGIRIENKLEKLDTKKIIKEAELIKNADQRNKPTI